MEIRYDILCESSTEISRKLEEGLLDIGIIREPMELSKLDTQFLKKEGWIVAVAKEHPLAECESVVLKDISEEPLFIPSRSSLFEEISQWFSVNMGQPFVV